MSKYKEAGVDVAKTDNLVKEISGLVDNIGGFGGLFDLGDSYLVGATDGVGTKILLAQEYDMLDGIGIDCVAMCVNDIICTGARPLFFLDYFASSNVDEKQYLTIIDSIKRGCDEAGIPLIGGETAELPSLLPDKHFDIAGFCKIKKGDVVLAFPSNGFHSNGYSLVRKIFNKDKHEKYIDKILKPTEIYVKEIINLIDSGVNIKGIAHITGGGLSNLNRILPGGLSVNWKGEINKPFILDMFQKDGNISDEEMARVFNGGIGMCLVVEPKEVNKVFSGKIARPLIAVGNIV
jgi:phosphoribosylformylglycinamidine cyclo-ligase